MPAVREPIGGPVAAAAARTVAAWTAQLFAAWCTGSPLPEAPDRRCEGVADFAARRARVSQALFLTVGDHGCVHGTAVTASRAFASAPST